MVRGLLATFLYNSIILGLVVVWPVHVCLPDEDEAHHVWSTAVDVYKFRVSFTVARKVREYHPAGHASHG